MFKRISLLALCAFIGLAAGGCSEDNESSPCPTCPERDPVSAAVEAFFDLNGESLGLRAGIDEMRIIRTAEDRFGNTHVRLNQFYRGVRVEFGQLILHLNQNLEEPRVSGEISTAINLSVRPRLDSREALDAAEDNMEADGYVVTIDEPDELIVFRFDEEDYLCWRVGLRAVYRLAAYDYFVSAVNGDVVYRRNKIIVSALTM